MNLTEMISSMRGWTGFSDPTVFTDAMITSWIRMGEERLSRELRVADMLQIDTATIIHKRVVLPPDYQSMDFCRVVDGKELIFKPRGDFFNQWSDRQGYYTTSGNYLIIGGEQSASDPVYIELHYFGDVPALGSTANWVSTKYLTILTAASMEWASTRMEDSEQKANWSNDAGNAISVANTRYLQSIGAGSRLSRRVGSFG